MTGGRLTGANDQDPVWRLLAEHLPWMVHGDLFSTQHFGAGPCLDQGWKLHVSATPWSAPEVLQRCLPVLLDFGVSCKVVNTCLRLLLLNNGHFGNDQVGKFITGYPSGDEQAVRLAVALDQATAGLAGPRVPTDRPLRPRSLVHYRYGAFRRPGLATGEVPDARGDLRDSAGRLLPDRRQFSAGPPLPGGTDPFEAAGAYVPAEPGRPPLAGRYLIVDVLATSAYGAVYRAIDLGAAAPQVCVLKEFRRDCAGDVHGRLAPDWGHKEADLLARHNPDPVFPYYLDRFELDGNLFVALEYVEGRSVAAELAAREDRAETFPLSEVIAIGEQTSAALAHLHTLGVVLRDFNPANLIHTPDDAYRIVDFGIAHEYGAEAGPPNGLGTANFSSPQQWADGPPAATDDVFAWGAVMHLLLGGNRSLVAARRATGAGLGPVRRRPVREVRPEVPPQLAELIDRATAWLATDRFPSMRDVQGAFRTLLAAEPAIDVRAVEATREAGRCTGPTSGAGLPDESTSSAAASLDYAREVGDALCASGISRDGGTCWATYGSGVSFCGADIYHGAAGIALFLAELGRATGEGRYTEAARAAARWLAGPAWAPGRAEPGLYCGESGVGWCFIRLADILDQPGYLSAAELRARRLRGLPLDSLDLIQGAAGLVVFLVRLARATGKSEYLDQARAVGDQIVNAARTDAGDRPDAGVHPLGLAHGTAGIGFALVELAAATSDERVLWAAHSAAELLLAEARPDPRGGWNWREYRHDEPMRVQGQCHGAIGIGQFFLRITQLDPRQSYLTAVREAATTAIREMPHRSSPVLCHGLAGDGMLLLDCHRRLGEPQFSRQAHECADHLRRFRDPDRPGVYQPAAGARGRPDLLTGDAGIGWFHLRLARPDLLGDPVLDTCSAANRVVAATNTSILMI